MEPVTEGCLFKIANSFFCERTTEIREGEVKSKKLNKYVAAFDYVDKVLLVLSAANIVVSITSLDTAIGAPVRKASVSINLIFSFGKNS